MDRRERKVLALVGTFLLAGLVLIVWTALFVDVAR